MILKVSVCIPTYSRLNYLKQAVKSVLEQDYNNLEICVSQDPTPAGANKAIKDWCELKLQQEKKFRYHLNNKNLGLAGNWNQLIKMASGDYLIIIGDDDLLQKEYISKMVKLINITNADVAFSNQYFIDEQGKVIEESNHLNTIYKRDELKHGIIKDTTGTVFNNSIPMSASLIKRDLLEQYKFDEDLNTPEFELFLKLALKGKKFVYCNEQLAYYRIHNTSATSCGLSIQKLIKKIIPIEVPQKYKKVKYDFISSKIIPAINMSLRSGDKLLAKYLLNSEYYPKNEKIKKFIQKVLLFMPLGIIRKLL